MKIIQMFVNERYDLFAVADDGRVFKKRAVGHSGTYGKWVEVPFLEEIKRDCNISDKK